MVPPNEDASRRSPFTFDVPADLRALREAIRAGGLTDEGFSQALAVDATEKLMDLAAALRRTAAPSPLHTLLRLFVLGRRVTEGEVRAALRPLEIDPFAALGLLHRDGGDVWAEASLIPHEDLLLARDFWPDFTELPMPPDYVLGVGAASQTSASLTVRRPVQAALDLGTGCGYLAILAARHAERVVATDTNARALAFAQLNAGLAGAAGIELRQGSLYEPVAGETFDLIMSNPPFVISPESRYDYRDGGLPGDTLAEQVVRGAPAHLREGGFASILLEWHHADATDWAARPTRWADGSGCDAWILRWEDRDPVAYAAAWLRAEAAPSPEAHARQLDEWLAYYERLGIRRICSGAIILRRRSSACNWVHAEEKPQGETTGSCSDQIQRIFAARDFLQALRDDRQLLDATLRLTADHQFEHILQAEGGRWAVRSARLTQRRGFPYVGNVDRLVGTLLVGCDGQRTLRSLVADLARSVHADPEQVAASAATVFRKLLETGFLTVA